jgi:hypothetical protein
MFIPALGPIQPLVQFVHGFFLSLGVERLGCEVDHSPARTADIKNEWSYTSAPPVCLNGVYRGKFGFICTNAVVRCII